MTFMESRKIRLLIFSALATAFSFALCSCVSSQATPLIFDLSGFGPLHGEKKQEAIASGDYYRIFEVSSVFTRGFCFYNGKRAGSLDFNKQGLLVREQYRVAVLGKSVQDATAKLTYTRGRLSHAEVLLDGHKAEDLTVTYSPNGLPKESVIYYTSWIGSHHRYVRGKSRTTKIAYKYSDSTLVRTYTVAVSSTPLMERISYRTASLGTKRGFLDPLTNYDQMYYANRNLAIYKDAYYLNGTKISQRKALNYLEYGSTM